MYACILNRGTSEHTPGSVFYPSVLKPKSFSGCCRWGRRCFSSPLAVTSPGSIFPWNRCPRVTHMSLQAMALFICWPGQVSPNVRLSQGGLGLEFCSFSFLTTLETRWRQADRSLPVCERLWPMGCHASDHGEPSPWAFQEMAFCPSPILKISQVSSACS